MATGTLGGMVSNNQRRRGFDWGGMVGSKPAAPAAPNYEKQMQAQAGSIEAQENQRYQSGLATATGAFNKAQQVLSQGVDTSLLFSQAADQIGARAGANMEALRSSLGARGLNPNSGAAQGLLSRLAFNQENALTGATRDIALEDQKRRQVNAALSFSNAMQLAGLINAPVSSVGLDTTQNLFEGQIAREGIASQRKSNKEANKTNILGGLIGGGASILAGLI